MLQLNCLIFERHPTIRVECSFYLNIYNAINKMRTILVFVHPNLENGVHCGKEETMLN